jgi:nucleoside-diphosphate-sugar epimerase
MLQCKSRANSDSAPLKQMAAPGAGRAPELSEVPTNAYIFRLLRCPARDPRGNNDWRQNDDLAVPCNDDCCDASTRCVHKGVGAKSGRAAAGKWNCVSMRVLVTGSAGHLGEALVRTLRDLEHDVVGLDICEGPFTSQVGSITDLSCIGECMNGVQAVLHAATLHKPHVATHSRQDFVDVNVTGTLNLLEAAVTAGVEAFVYTSTTSVFGDALRPPADAPAAWVTEDVRPVPRNIYGVTKGAAEDLCQLFHRNQGLSCIVLRTSRFFPEEDDDKSVRDAYADANVKANEFLHRRVELEDVVSAHMLAMQCAPAIGFARYIISATTPFLPEDLPDLRADAAQAVRRRVPAYEAEYARRGWRMPRGIDRVYVNERARHELGWQPRYDFARILDRLRAGQDMRSPLARLVGSKGYHAETFAEGPYPVE